MAGTIQLHDPKHPTFQSRKAAEVKAAEKAAEVKAAEKAAEVKAAEKAKVPERKTETQNK